MNTNLTGWGPENDPFCESELWNDPGMPIAQPMATITGLAMIAMGWANNYVYEGWHWNRLSKLFLVCKASLVLVGVGTVVYHATTVETMGRAHLNHGQCDWLPIVLMCSNLVILYLSHMLRARIMDQHEEVAIITGILAWIFVLVMAIDSNTDSYWSAELGADQQNLYGTIINIFLLVPLGVILAYASVYHLPWHDSKYLFLSLAASLLLWAINGYLCRQNPWLAVMHALYHVTIAYGFVYAACLGACIHQSAWVFLINPWGWPTMVPNPYHDYSYYT